jgi:hypothetical protein
MKKHRVNKVEDKLKTIYKSRQEERYKIDLSGVATEKLYEILEEDSKIEYIVYNSEVDKAYFMTEQLINKIGLSSTDFLLAPYGGDNYRAIPKEILSAEDLNRVDVCVFNFFVD